jgi:hypothetical protein
MKIAFLFLIGDTIEYETVWAEFFKHAPKNQYSIYVHPKQSKTKLTDPLFKKAIIPSVDTAWGDLVPAEMQLFKYAYKSKSNQIFVLISNTTIPLKRFSQVYTELSTRTKSSIECSKLKDSDDQFDCSDLEDWGVKKSTCKKGSQWLTLVRNHVGFILDYEELLDVWGMRNKGVIGDEIFIPTLMTEYGKHNELISECDTWIDWGKRASDNSPATYKRVELKLITSLISSDYLFARKFVHDAIVVVDNKKVIHLRNILSYMIEANPEADVY